MKNKIIKKQKRIQRRVRSKIIRQSDFPRLTVHRSNNHIYAQVIDDFKMVTLASESDSSFKKEKMTRTQKAQEVGKKLAEQLNKKKVKQVVFDRGARAYAGRIKALADSVREGGITI